MSGIKRYLEDVEDRGWESSNDTVCSRCLRDSALITAIQKHGGHDQCTYCELTPQPPHASAPLDHLAELVVEGLRCEYEDPIESIMVVKGEYQWPVMETSELLDYLDVADDCEIHLALEQIILTKVWCPRDPYRESDASRTHAAWEKFADLVRTKRRYTSHLYRPSDSYGLDEDITGSVTLKILEYIRQADLFITSPAEETWWRGRVTEKGDRITEVSELGPPPADKALDNRMSPKGIPIFYGASTREGARAEILNQSDDDKGFSFGQFTPTRPLRFVDLRTNIATPSLFDQEQRHKRVAVDFLKGFTQKLREPGPPSDHIKIDYIPTQIIAETIRFELRDLTGEAVDGILWSSSQTHDVTCCAIFIDTTQVSDSRHQNDKTVLILDLDEMDHGSGTAGA